MQRHGCRPSDHPLMGRRELLQVGSLGLFGTGLSDLLRMEAQAAETPVRGTAKSVVFIFQSGGPSQHETFDPKPEAPDSIRGEYGTTATRVPGVRFCDPSVVLGCLRHRRDQDGEPPDVRADVQKKRRRRRRRWRGRCQQ